MPAPYLFGGRSTGSDSSDLHGAASFGKSGRMYALTLMAALASAVPAARAQGDVRPLFTADDYPVGALLLGQEGAAQAKLTVGPNGRVMGCEIVRSSSYPALDSATCALLTRRAKFRPARDASGLATVDEYITPPVNWVIEGNGLSLGPWAIRLRVGLDKRGNATDCAIQYGGSLEWRSPLAFECSQLDGVFQVPKDLAARFQGRRVVLIYDQQFVPRFIDTINTPSDLKAYPLLTKTVVRFGVDPDGRVVGCSQVSVEGDYKTAEDGCADVRGRRFEHDAKGLVGDRAATATTAIYVDAK